ncbi:hypothetical protein [Bacillus sp. FJAT-52991]|uniref:HTH psq-type domain-containing protein n=1 Tax=Bacillus kandeliae TaxID=3129297 RepID=A0ABZ2NB88_9BACI
MNRKYDWNAVEQFFIDSGYESRVSLKDVSERFNIPYQTVRRYAAAHKWHSKRYRVWIEKEHGMSFEEHLQVLYEEAMNRN